MSPTTPFPPSMPAARAHTRSGTSVETTTTARLLRPIAATRRLLLAGTRARAARQKLRRDRRRTARASRQAEGAKLVLARGLEESYCVEPRQFGRFSRQLTHHGRMTLQ